MVTEIDFPRVSSAQGNAHNETITRVASDTWKSAADKTSVNKLRDSKESPLSISDSSTTKRSPSQSEKKIESSKDPLDYVDPFIGTGGPGHTYPGATVPFGMVQLSPDTRHDTWDGCSGYLYSDSKILGFSHTHLSGTGCGDLGDVSFMPTTKAIDSNLELDPAKYSHSFLHKDETASPGYYSVKMGDIKAELTASEHVGMHRYTFPKSTDSKIILDLTHGISDQPTDLTLKVIDDHTVVGLRRSTGWAKDQYEYFAASFSKPFSSHGTDKDHEKPVAGANSAEGKQLSAWFNFDTTDGAPVVAKVALSSVSEDAAMKNLQAEAPDFDFDKMHEKARESWRQELSKVNISTNDDSKARSFYTAMYHSLVAPTIVSDVDGGYRGSDIEVHQAKGFKNYSTFSLWDTFRAEQPLFTIIEPERVNDMMNSFLVQAEYAKDKHLPMWPLASNETNCMIGFPAFPVVAEAYAKGYRNWDAESMYKLMVENSKFNNDWWAKKGYMPADAQPESVSKTLEYSYDDWCLSQFARALGHNEDAEKYAKRSEFYKNVFDKETGFMRGRLSNGSWRTPFDPTEIPPLMKRDFTEANAWQYSFFVPHDVPNMIKMYGGRERFVDKLDKLFTTPMPGPPGDADVSGLIGQYAQGNEPSHHVAYLYSYAGAPEKTADRVKQIRDTLYKDTPDGLCGNEDCGQMSAWYIFSSLGFYPVNPVGGEYVIGTPSFDKAEISVPGGKKFQVLAPGLSDKNIYVQKATLNGKPLNHTYITQDEIMQGGTLELTMTDKPGDWGRAPEAAPH